MSCLNVFFNSGAFSGRCNSTICPSTRAQHKSLLMNRPERLLMFPLLPANQRREDHHFQTRPVISSPHRQSWLDVWLLITRPHFQQWGVPARAQQHNAGNRKSPSSSRRSIADCSKRSAARSRSSAGSPSISSYIWLLKLIEKLPGIRGERLHVFPLSLGKDGIKRQRRFAGARQTRDDHQLIAWQGPHRCSSDCARAPRGSE